MSGTGGNVHILIVDDDRLVLTTLGRGLRNAGYEVSEANDGPSALALVSRVKPDLALLDVRMPGMSGVQVAEQLTASHHIPFMFLSAYGSAENIAQAKALGAVGYLVKPLDVTQIIPAIEAALARASEIDALKDKGDQLTEALESGRETSMAVGILMERRGLDRVQAFDALRSHARTQRRRVQEVAAELVDAVDAINKTGRVG